jgi:hypothetical protein
MLKPYNIVIKAKLYLDIEDRKKDPDQFVQDTAIFFSENLTGWDLLEVEVYDADMNPNPNPNSYPNNEKAGPLSSFKILEAKTATR